MTDTKIVHLVDDTTAGGVMRMLDHLLRQPGLLTSARQSVVQIDRGALAIGRIDADVIVSHLTISWRGLPGLIALRAMNPTARLVHVEHSYTRAFTALNVARKKRFLALMRVAYALFDRIVAVSHAQADWMQERNLAAADAIRVIHPTVDMRPLAAVPARSGAPRVIGAIGRLDRQKGFDILIEAFRLCPEEDARLLIFGEGSEREALERLAAGDTRIAFLGHLASPEEAYGAVDVVAMPSRWEAFGLVADEAKRAGRLRLLASVDGLRDQIASPLEAVSQNDPKNWARALQRVFRSDMKGAALPGNGTDASRVFEEKWRAVLLGEESEMMLAVSA